MARITAERSYRIHLFVPTVYVQYLECRIKIETEDRLVSSVPDEPKSLLLGDAELRKFLLRFY